MKNNISYEKYLEMMKQEVAARTGKRVQLQTIRKNNGLVLDGLTIIAEDTNVSPTIYLNSYYKEFLVAGMDAVGMLQMELVNAIMKKFKIKKLIILPSSVHEVLLVPYNKDMEETDFKTMVREVNETQLEPDEYLSNNVYVYDGNELKFFE